MDLQTSLKTALRKKYHNLNNGSHPLLPSRFCYRTFEDDDKTLCYQEFRYFDHSDSQSWMVYDTIPLVEVLSCDCKHDTSKRTVMTLGVYGIGKTTAVQQCVLDWAEDKAYPDIQLLFPLKFWELYLLGSDCKMNLIELLLMFYPELKELHISSLNEKNVWFIFDGLDEYRYCLNFSCPKVSDVSQRTTVNSLVTNLIRGNLLPKAHIWLTTRHATATQIPHPHILRYTEIQGFDDKQKELHIRDIVNNDQLANRVIDHVKISRSLDFLCQIPSMCTIMATVLKDHLEETEDDFEISPMSLTQIFSNLIRTFNFDIAHKMKEIAESHLWMDGLLFEDDLMDHYITLDELSAFSQEYPLVLREEKGLRDVSVFHFGHICICEFLNGLREVENTQFHPVARRSKYYKHLVDTAMGLENGLNDVHLRFIFGLIKERRLLEASNPLFYYMKMMILDNILTYKAVRLFHCLREFDSQALLNEVTCYMKTRSSPIPGFSSDRWELISQMTANFEGMRHKFEMEVCTRCDERLLRQLPALLKSIKAMLRFSNLTDKCCPALAAVLSTKESYLRELDLGCNCIGDSGVEKLVQGLTNPNCKLKTLRLQGCGLTSPACRHLATALRRSQRLRELDLSANEIGDDGLKHLSSGLESPECQLETLKLSQCNIEGQGCYYLSSALQKNSTHLKWLDLSINTIGDEAANDLFAKFDISKLTKLEMYHCGLTVLSCENIGEALKVESSNLVEFNLSNNNLADAGFEKICEGMVAWSRLEKFNLSRCGITSEGCRYISKVLACISQLYSQEFLPKTCWQAVELTDLDLSINCLTDKGVKELSTGLKNPYSHLKTLNLSYCSLTHDCCTELASALASYESTVSELDLSGNKIQDKGVRTLCLALTSTQCKLEKLLLRSCGFSSRSIDFFTTALKSNRRLTELHIMGNNLNDQGINVLMEMTQNEKYMLKSIDVSTD
ncbi:NACHT, LRR and PYD domains-containing protein 14-like [Sphaeramia orbicularis]|uniref:NACHT, LRR and PYD domains-containing protein 14-like n=1 Tax=Sphaeramia orbicularis TaxID=375764 RepID=UPI00117E65B7|nr:NACHT, LRR and PYD domains-containing protein 14-like [Sphaeramia orbicularis]XP_029998100.1 NACHT, LRR and PYD domains-containing protein 14-like [Sphaeramia orbicularis]